jgi:hypothetical protein
MTPGDSSERDAIMARLAQTRGEISRLLEPPPSESEGQGPGPSGMAGGFPRSRTMRALMTGRGIGAVGALAGGLLLARPRMAWRLLRMLPTGAVTRMVVGRLMGAMRGRR